MANPITIHHEGALVEELFGLTECPYFNNYPLRGLPWDVIKHKDYNMSLQEIDFIGNHMQLLEMECLTGTSIRFSVNEPSIFFAIMIEGFVKFQKAKTLVSYAMRGVLYMTYSPSADFTLHASAGKHTMMIVCIDSDWFKSAKRPFPRLEPLVNCIQQRNDEVLTLPMCRFAQPIADLWDSMRMLCSDNFLHKLELANHVTKLIEFYNTQLENDNYIKGQLVTETANLFFMYVDANYMFENRISIALVSEHLGESKTRVEEYAKLLFGKSLLKHVRDLRMAKAAQLLKETDVPVSALGFKVGYSNRSHFFKIFNAYFDTSPLEYRAQHRIH
ncbi:helix-turn-helix transcriptional regulator [Sphingobacterium phlebotomi]|uniref:Helix-turn-helix transcriptional regulator n=1 Tax=Sphingobacterium phlebotomi TaxID=2605433 RepID=A0A5D4HA06_9SPHI|nr:helix-turn-helix transcriptional regulator [Sphingobacterium phlebotomi]TYR37434.1 helix-turn-helix transcriptional regulator [Sphingobacterium phlebotomi]